MNIYRKVTMYVATEVPDNLTSKQLASAEARLEFEVTEDLARMQAESRGAYMCQYTFADVSAGDQSAALRWLRAHVADVGADKPGDRANLKRRIASLPNDALNRLGVLAVGWGVFENTLLNELRPMSELNEAIDGTFTPRELFELALTGYALGGGDFNVRHAYFTRDEDGVFVSLTDAKLAMELRRAVDVLVDALVEVTNQITGDVKLAQTIAEILNGPRA